MTNKPGSRRKFLAATAAIAATSEITAMASGPDTESAQSFVTAWDEAWANHDAQVLGSLHTEDAVTVNRFGTVVQGRTNIRDALAFLHQNNGPFSRASAPPQKILDVRSIDSNVMAIHTKWQSPVMNPDGKLDPLKVNDMIVSFILVKTSSGWKAAEVDLHNVEKMDLPFSNPAQRP